MKMFFVEFRASFLGLLRNFREKYFDPKYFLVDGISVNFQDFNCAESTFPDFLRHKCRKNES